MPNITDTHPFVRKAITRLCGTANDLGTLQTKRGRELAHRFPDRDTAAECAGLGRQGCEGGCDGKKRRRPDEPHVFADRARQTKWSRDRRLR